MGKRVKSPPPKKGTVKDLIRLAPAMTDEEFLAALAALDEHEKDLVIPCPNKRCHAKEGDECRGLPVGVVHFGRRLYRLLKWRIR
jgi:hypothetical protein